jgi:hypothetical protein
MRKKIPLFTSYGCLKLNVFVYFYQVASKAKVLRNEAAFLANKLELFTASYLN